MFVVGPCVFHLVVVRGPLERVCLPCCAGLWPASLESVMLQRRPGSSSRHPLDSSWFFSGWGHPELVKGDVDVGSGWIILLGRGEILLLRRAGVLLLGCGRVLLPILFQLLCVFL